MPGDDACMFDGRCPTYVETVSCFGFVLGWDAKELRTALTRGDCRRNADDGDERRVAEAVGHIEAL
jgi:hypothetical protein